MRQWRLVHVVLPAHMIVGVQADLEARVECAAHHIARAAPDVGSGQHHPVQQGLHAVVLEHRGARDLLRESLAKHPAQGAPCVVGPHREIEGRVHPEPLQQRH